MADGELGPVKQWSFSRLSNFEKCPHMVYLASVEKLKGPDRDETHPAERGTRIHGICEKYVDGTSDDTVKEMGHFMEDFELLREPNAPPPDPPPPVDGLFLPYIG